MFWLEWLFITGWMIFCIWYAWDHYQELIGNRPNK